MPGGRRRSGQAGAAELFLHCFDLFCRGHWHAASKAHHLAELAHHAALGPPAAHRLRHVGRVVLSAPPASAAGPGEYSAPEWLPLRNAATVGCVMSNCPGPYHDYWAIDLLDPEKSVGDPVFAAGAGQATVLTTSPTGACGGQGTPSNILQVDHGGGVTTRYIHLDSFSVSNGAWVDQNTQIGVMGTTGWTTRVRSCTCTTRSASAARGSTRGR